MIFQVVVQGDCKLIEKYSMEVVMEVLQGMFGIIIFAVIVGGGGIWLIEKFFG